MLKEFAGLLNEQDLEMLNNSYASAEDKDAKKKKRKKLKVDTSSEPSTFGSYWKKLLVSAGLREGTPDESGSESDDSSDGSSSPSVGTLNTMTTSLRISYNELRKDKSLRKF